MDRTIQKLLEVHGALAFTPPDGLQTEIPEQLMACRHIEPDDIVLELGGSIGRNSCVINSLLTNKTHHVVVEPSSTELDTLKLNRDTNNLGFHIEHSAISDIPLYSLAWYTVKTQIEGSVEVSTITYDDLYSKYNLRFNVLVIDNEGNFVDTLRVYPNILNNIKTLIIEHDFNSNEDLQYFSKHLMENNFAMVDTYGKEEKFGPGMNWGDGVVTDPIFVSVWKRSLSSM
jgi:FkbM family methyltransferase